jgi:hypothetical protein
MKHTAVLFILIGIQISSHAQQCDGYFPSKTGAVMETTSYNEKGKPQSISKVKITGIESKGEETILKISSVITDEKGKQIASSDFDAHCDSGSFFINMKSFITAEEMKAWKDMTLSFDADDIDYPVNYFEGQKLNDAHLKVNVSTNGMNMPGMAIDITDRIVKGKETITTPAGTFECVKITSKHKLKNILSYEVDAAEWLSKGNGVIRTESFRNGKLKGYSLLTKLIK